MVSETYCGLFLAALTLSERSAIRNSALNYRPLDNEENRLLAIWKSHFPDEEAFEFRLSLEGFQSNDLPKIFRPTDILSDDLIDSTWLNFLEKSLTHFGELPREGRLIFQQQLVKSCHGHAKDFIRLAAPLIYWAERTCDQRLQSLNLRHLEQAPAAALFAGHLRQLSLMILERVGVSELHNARLAGKLTGQTPEERYKDFIRQLEEIGAQQQVLFSYPVMARLLSESSLQWVDAVIETVSRLDSDLPVLSKRFFGERQPRGLLAAEMGCGDLHCHGRSVTILTFTTGEKLVYKPRSLAMDSSFAALIERINRSGFPISLRCVPFMDCGNYGWEEYIFHRDCKEEVEIELFYRRVGAILCIVYLLRGNDIHRWNIRASGSYPMLIDLETLFHPELPIIDSKERESVSDQALKASVLSVGLLPTKLFKADLSGIGGADNEVLPYPAPVWSNVGTDLMQLTFERRRAEPGSNRPTLNGNYVDLEAYVQSVIDGFHQTYNFILNRRDIFLDLDEGPLQSFRKATVRVLRRPTHFYFALLANALHPSALRNGLDHTIVLDYLWSMEVCGSPYNTRSEVNSLRRLDIPIFRNRTLATDDHGSESRLELAISPWEHVKTRLLKMSDQHCREQVWFIKASMATLSPRSEPARSKTGVILARVRSNSVFLDAARLTADKILSLALKAGEEIAFLGLRHSSADEWTLRPLEFDLYNGLSGIALFFAYLGAATKDECHRAFASGLVATIRKRLSVEPLSVQPMGVFSGIAGWLYLLTHLGCLWNDPSLLEEAVEIASVLDRFIEADTNNDVLAGTAGLIPVLCSLAEIRSRSALLNLARKCGDRLLETAQEMQRGKAWIPGEIASRPLTGFAHGSAGIIWALFYLAFQTNEDKYARLAYEGLQYERSTFLTVESNWPDLRQPDAKLADLKANGKPQGGAYWCYGAPGVALGRVDTPTAWVDDEMAHEISCGIAVCERDVPDNHSLCHGALGNYELLLRSATKTGDHRLEARARELSASIVSSVANAKWLCGTPMQVETPGLMVGSSGIGFELLRFYDPALVPSVLLLEGPHI